MLTLRTNDFQHVLPELVQRVQESGATPRLVRIEGTMGVGKSLLAKMLADKLPADKLSVLHGDHHAFPDGTNRAYTEAINVGALRARLTNLLQQPAWTIIEAVCLGELAPEDVFGRGFVIYVQRVSVLGPDIHLWHGFDKHGPIDERPLFRSIHDYHKHFRPHENADVLMVLPEEQHSFDDRPPREQRVDTE